jgi:hypothetical protein
MATRRNWCVPRWWPLPHPIVVCAVIITGGNILQRRRDNIIREFGFAHCHVKHPAL